MVGSILLTAADDPRLLPRPAVPVRDGHQRRKCGCQVTTTTPLPRRPARRHGGCCSIDGEPQRPAVRVAVLLPAAPEQWRARLEQVRASGYPCVDVYLPWNFHETAPGAWDFAGPARRRRVPGPRGRGRPAASSPGPARTSAPSGTAARCPAWLGLDPELQVRQNEPRFLAQVERWFDQVLPLLARAPARPRAGAVIMVQLENELDFFDCAGPHGLHHRPARPCRRRTASPCRSSPAPGRATCQAPTGDVEGVVPACNFYPDDSSPDIEAEVRRYARAGGPRAAAAGHRDQPAAPDAARGCWPAAPAARAVPAVAPAGTSGYTPSVGNWGDPGNFMTHGYDFGGYVSAEVPGVRSSSKDRNSPV